MARPTLRARLLRLITRRPPRGFVAVPTPAPAASSTIEYAPERDGEPDPGEVVWGWVPYEEDASQGKDRPVLLLGREGTQWLALMLTSKDHDKDAGDEARYGRHWIDVGSGPWDRQGRPSEVRLDRLLKMPQDSIRREGSALPRETFDAVASAARAFHRFG